MQKAVTETDTAHLCVMCMQHKPVSAFAVHNKVDRPGKAPRKQRSSRCLECDRKRLDERMGGNVATDSTVQGMAKELLYKWSKADQMGTMMMVNKHEISVDPRYQRDVNEAKRLKIASDFRWPGFGVLTCALRKNGSLYVIDGQHRLAAAMNRTSVTEVPCIVFDVVDDVAFEAEMFILANKNRKPVTARETYRADLMRGDPVSLACEALVTSHNYTVTAPDRHIPGNAVGRYITCIRALKTAMALHPDITKAMFPLLIDIAGGGHIAQRVFVGVIECERRIRIHGHTLLDHRDKLIAAGQDAIAAEIFRTAEFRRSSGPRVWSEGVLNVVNHKKRNRLFFDTVNVGVIEADDVDDEA
jgi:hypothetical protein